MPDEDFLRALPDATAIVSGGWRYGDVLDQASSLRAILTVSGGWPPELDYAGVLPARDQGALGGACVRRRCGGDGARPRARLQPRRRDRRPGDASRERALARRRVRRQLLARPASASGSSGTATSAVGCTSSCEPFRCEVAVYDPWLTDAYLLSQEVTPASLEDMLRSSRVVFVLATPSSENRARALSRADSSCCRPGSVLVLVSRAHVVDFDALTELVLAGRFKAGIDVFPTEPLEPEHPIRQAPGAVLSAHRAGPLEEALLDIGTRVVDDLEAIVRGLPPRRLQVAEPELASRHVRTTTLVVPRGPQ